MIMSYRASELILMYQRMKRKLRIKRVAGIDPQVPEYRKETSNEYYQRLIGFLDKCIEALQKQP